jgi:hypothetical protein
LKEIYNIRVEKMTNPCPLNYSSKAPKTIETYA